MEVSDVLCGKKLQNSVDIIIPFNGGKKFIHIEKTTMIAEIFVGLEIIFYFLLLFNF